jgi:hypothetical protein
VPEYKAHGDAMMGILMDRLQRRAYRVNMVNLSDDPTSILPWKQMSFDEFKEL